MNLDRYALTAGTYSTIFEFTSEGPKGYISKIVAFQNIGPGIYNLAFGDKNDLTGDFDDQATSDNGDSEKVLATVVQALYKFFDAYPSATVYAVGSTKVRTRLYRMGITQHLNEAVQDFELYGRVGDDFFKFEVNTQYSAFLVRKRNY
ncbi:DUF6934 family protein [Dyadobacter bucti]|uniref:DUF6934 family protein n=1 Tax=Dyadobacter bucti TaxID=2572203 RepID=UPI003F6EE53A